MAESEGCISWGMDTGIGASPVVKTSVEGFSSLMAAAGGLVLFQGVAKLYKKRDWGTFLGMCQKERDNNILKNVPLNMI